MAPHLPLTVDTEIPVRVAGMLVEKLKVVVAPAVPYGSRSLPQSGGGPSFPGTTNIRGSILTDLRSHRALSTGRKAGRHKDNRRGLVESCFKRRAGEALW
jgi:creatinine amidohydrolase